MKRFVILSFLIIFISCKREKCTTVYDFVIGDSLSYQYSSLTGYLYYFNMEKQNEDSIYIFLECSDFKELDSVFFTLSDLGNLSPKKNNQQAYSGNPFIRYIILNHKDSTSIYKMSKNEYYGINNDESQRFKKVYEYVVNQKILKRKKHGKN